MMPFPNHYRFHEGVFMLGYLKPEVLLHHYQSSTLHLYT